MSPTSRLFDIIHGWLSRPRGFFEPRPLEVHGYYGRDGECYMVDFNDPLPRVVLVTDKLMRMWDPEVPSLEELGYEKYDRSMTMRADYYACRPWLWLLRASIWARRRFWRVLSWSHGRLWHLKRNAFNQPFRWRNARPGSGVLGEVRLAANNLQATAYEQRREIDDLKHDKAAAYARGTRAGWDQHQKVLENLASGMTVEEVVARLKSDEESDDLQKTKD